MPVPLAWEWMFLRKFGPETAADPIANALSRFVT